MSRRVGAVSYLNTKPLIFGLAQRLGEPITLDLPSRLARDLSEDRLDVALIPSVEFLRAEGVSIVSDACIGCRGPVRSVRLLFRVPPCDVRTLALDEGSRTSAALSQVLLDQLHNVRPQLTELPINADYRSVSADAILVIGDRAMEVCHDDYVETWDLGERWVEMTGLPFVFAMWVAASDSVDSSLSKSLTAARDEGMLHLRQIAEEEAPRYALSVEDCLRYFEDQLYFHLGQRELAGLDLFRSYAADLGLVPNQCRSRILVPT